ncbi:hypothetical protein [Thermogladius sp.]|uniref:hypothetical protein n=1 Tax=Thermogladius sp. TaxID=2023064 RepID=UPI003D146D6E
MSEEVRHYESVGSELEAIRKASVEFMVKKMALRRVDAEKRVNEILLIWNVIRDYFRWFKNR